MADPKPKSKTPGNNDFNLEEIAPTVSRHETDLLALAERVKTIEFTLTPDGFMEFLEKVQEDRKRMDGFFSKVFIYLLQKDEDVKKTITAFMKSCDRGTVWQTLKIFGGFVSWLVTLLIAAYIGHMWQ